MTYFTFKDEDGNAYGSFEVFHQNVGTWTDEDGEQHEDGPGWYWWACFPGCMPDGDLIGPFETRQEAIDDAQS